MRDYDYAIKYDPKYTIAYYNRGLLKIALNDVANACSDFSKASQLNYAPANDAIRQYCNSNPGLKF